MAAIRPHGNGWRVVWRDGGRTTKQQYSQHFDEWAEAAAFKDRIEAELAARVPVRPGELVPLTELLVRWRNGRVAVGNDPLWTQRIERYIAAVCAARRWNTVADITPQSITTWRESGGKARVGASLRAVLWWAKDTLRQPVADAVLVALRPPRTKRRPDSPLLERKRITAWIAEAATWSPDCAALVHCLSTYGWRPVTAARLNAGDFDLKRGTVRTLVKGGDTIEHPLMPATVAMMRDVLKGRRADAPAFLNHRTGLRFALYGSRSIHQWSRNWLHHNVYDLKRYAITTMLERGIDPKTIALFTGHRTEGQVLRYARTNEEKARAALVKVWLNMDTARVKVWTHADTRTPSKHPKRPPARKTPPRKTR